MSDSDDDRSPRKLRRNNRDRVREEAEQAAQQAAQQAARQQATQQPVVQQPAFQRPVFPRPAIQRPATPLRPRLPPQQPATLRPATLRPPVAPRPATPFRPQLAPHPHGPTTPSQSGQQTNSSSEHEQTPSSSGDSSSRSSSASSSNGSFHPSAASRRSSGARSSPSSSSDGTQAQTQDPIFSRETLASASILVPWPIQTFSDTQKFLFEYKRLSPRDNNTPFDVYCLRLCGVTRTEVEQIIRNFVPPYSALHRKTSLERTRPQTILETYQSIPSYEYTTLNISGHERSLTDAKIGDNTIYDISEFTFHFSRTNRALMDSFHVLLCGMYHILLTYIRYAAVMSQFLPILNYASFGQRMMLRHMSGCAMAYVFSDPAIITQTLCGIIIQYLLPFIKNSPQAEIRDWLKCTSIYYWLLLDGFFLCIAWALERKFPKYSQRLRWMPRWSFHAFWDVIGAGLDPVPFALKAGLLYLTSSGFSYQLAYVAQGSKLPVMTDTEQRLNAIEKIVEMVQQSTATVTETMTNTMTEPLVEKITDTETVTELVKIEEPWINLLPKWLRFTPTLTDATEGLSTQTWVQTSRSTSYSTTTLWKTFFEPVSEG